MDFPSEGVFRIDSQVKASSGWTSPVKASCDTRLQRRVKFSWVVPIGTPRHKLAILLTLKISSAEACNQMTSDIAIMSVMSEVEVAVASRRFVSLKERKKLGRRSTTE